MSTQPEFVYFDTTALMPLLKETSAACDSCGASPGNLYSGPFYSRDEVEFLCLDCIASGEAAKKFDGQFNDIVIRWEDGQGVEQVIDSEADRVPPAIIDELEHRTPGYETWQGNPWMFHCADGAVFYGDALKEHVLGASPEARAHWEAQNEMEWDEVMKGYVPGGGMGVYRFQCRHCGLNMFHWDMD